MLLLFETPAGYALFKVNSNKLQSIDAKELSKGAEAVSSVVKLKAFSPFESTTDAVVAATSIIESTLDKSLKKFLKKNIAGKDGNEELAVVDTKLGSLLKEKLEIKCVYNEELLELYRAIREHMESLIGESEDGSMKAMQLGLSHSLSRYKLKFTADKVDIMIIQAIGLLDDLDKEINIYAMRAKEWYGWHFPEMTKILNDNILYANIVLRMGMRTNCKNCDFSDLPIEEHTEELLKKSSETSMGTEISDVDLINIQRLCTEVISLSQYRNQLSEYLHNRMAAIAPNLTMMVGELVGARLIAHSGSLINLAKHPASTIQILGAEKALFRALKTKTDTPKYGLIYHASLIGQAQPKIKGKISRLLAAKTALGIRVDAFGEGTGPTVSVDNRVKVEARIRQLEGGQRLNMSANKASSGPAKYESSAAKAIGLPKYQEQDDVVLESNENKKKSKKRDRDDSEGGEKKAKKHKADK